MGVLLRKITGFSGLVHENMYRFTGWRFLSIGRSLERAIAMAGALAWLADPEAPDGALDLAVEIGDSVMSHRRRYAVTTTRETVVDLLALDTHEPALGALPPDRDPRPRRASCPTPRSTARCRTSSRAVLQAHTGLAVETPETVDGTALRALDPRDRGAVRPALRHLPALSRCSTTSA